MIFSLIIIGVPLPGKVDGYLLSWTFEGKVPTDSADNSLPSIVEGPNSTVWLVWQSLPPIPSVTPKITLKTYHLPSIEWSNDLDVTAGTESDTSPDIIRLANHTMMIVWSRGSKDADLFYRLNTANVWSPEFRLTSGPSRDLSPSLFQDSEGRIWVVWERGIAESLVYDSNANNSYDLGETVIAGPTPLVPIPSLKDDGKVRYIDANLSGIWDIGESVVYDSNTNGVYDLGESVISGPAPALGTSGLVDDGKVKYVDANSDNIWDFGAAELYYKFLDGSNWSNDLQLTNDSRFDQKPSMTQTRDGRIWVVWSSNRINSQLDIFYKTFNNTVWSADTLLFDDTAVSCRPTYTSGCDDRDPDIVQDRNGTINVFWSRFLPSGSGTFLGEIYTISSTDAGRTFPLANFQSMSSPINDPLLTDNSPAASKFSDTRIRIFWTRPSNTLPGAIDILHTKSEPILTHDAAILLVGHSETARWNTTFDVMVTVVNLGDFPETVAVAVTVGTATVATSNTIVGVGSTTTAILTVKYENTTTLAPGRHSVIASVTVAQEPAGNLPDNSLLATNRIVLLPPGDVDLDGDVELVDAVLLTQSFGTTPGSPGWRAEADINVNGVVDMLDVMILARWIDARI